MLNDQHAPVWTVEYQGVVYVLGAVSQLEGEKVCLHLIILGCSCLTYVCVYAV